MIVCKKVSLAGCARSRVGHKGLTRAHSFSDFWERVRGWAKRCEHKTKDHKEFFVFAHRDADRTGHHRLMMPYSVVKVPSQNSHGHALQPHGSGSVAAVHMVQSAALHDGLTWTDQFAHGLQGAPMRKAGRHDRHISRADQLCERQPPELPHLAREDHLQHLRATSVVHPHDDMCYHGERREL